ncbi:hypothetical protein PF010_g2991 [Phytophthora fragariae]|uniref:NACHT domain-containing protein n=1 Tax=Phytophthora fragariae TaxID=53985 RepID=A0A6A4EKX3_9STRA|nr:hypothetical protein PF003_g27248 [Phytophthora fragariae]KAE8948421.1 hypothetical protein PF009_g1999 [Phytophthora fragariae]KAE9132953.1 hypothetical protein PF010_g2991 [Phytophthora fragariae]KAE9253300.1 hypothetical protein PF004_g1557 [Phytophthora fragariae]KAE9255840.1 hypothetical protein PF002_g2140 [Phytophthora fragariae]
MGKPPSPSKKGSGHIGGRALSATRSDSGSAAFDDADGGVTSTPPRVESTIVNRETATHLAFAKSRKEDFVYAPTSHYFHILNDHCQWDHEVRSALLAVVGQPGDGKSALLANWAEERRRSVKGERELIYEHYCGCSYDSVKLSLFLFRFMNQLKISYSLRDFELPREHEEEKLKFSFSRCLEAAVGKGEHTTGSASKRKRIILVLDGIDCIRTEDGGDSLSWLPNNFPAGVRIIVSSTQIGTKGKPHFRRCQKIVRQPAVYDSDGDLIYETTLPPRDKESHTIRELRRRNAAFMVAEPLDEVSCSAILEMYEQRFSRELDPEEKQLIVAARGSSSPLYVRLLLNGLELFDPSESDQRHQWLDQACESNQLNCVYELLMKQWNVILLNDLFAELEERTAFLEAAASSSSNGGAPLFTSDRSGVDQNGGARSSIKGAPVELSGANNNNGLSSKLNATNIPIDIEDIESLQVTIEQRSLLIRHTLSLLAVSRYGLSENDFVRLFGESISRSICQRLLALLKPHLMTIRRYDCGPGSQNPGSSISASVGNSNKESGNQDNGGEPVVLYDLSHNQLRILTRYGFLLDDQLRGCYYRELAVYFEAMEACQRRVDELPVQLERCSMWGVLQSSLVNMKMFQLWWTERNRQEFFFYWMVLSSNCSMHDPVDDFIRSLDEYIAQESPSMEQLLSIFLTITDFLRAWQKIDESRVVNLVLNRPKPPQLQEFLASLGTFSTSNLSESEAERVQKEIEALVIHPDDGYYVRRWLWTQFPLIGTAFESRVFRSTGSSRTPADGDSTSGTRDESIGSECSGPGEKAFSTKTGAAKKALNSPVGVVLPKGIIKAKKTLVPTKRRPQHKVSTSLALESVTEEIGALEFLSAETGEGSVSKLESQLMELRMKYDRKKFLAREKNEALKSVESRVQDAKAEITAAGQSATQIDDLLENIRNVNDEATLGRQRSEYYKLILRHCELNPARDPKTIETAETTVAKLKREIVDLQQKTQVVSYEKRLASLDVPKLAQVAQDKASIHQEALSRLRWRQELDRRLYYASLSTKDSGQITLKPSATVSNSSPKKDPPHSSSAHSKSTRNSVTFTADDSTQTAPVDPNFFRAKDKLFHMKETSLARQKNAENLQLYVGSAYKDDGILGALRQVGINKPEEALLCWQNQLDHSVQLEEEEKQAEQRVLEYREKLELLQTQFVNLKLSGSSSGRVEGSTEDDASSANGDDEAAASKTSVNVKMLEKQLAEVKAVKQKKKERVARLRSLHEKLQLGLLHIAQLLGVTSVQQLNALEVVDSIEKVVRVALGDEAHLQAAPSPSFRHKNSTRMVNVPGQTGDSMGLPSDTRSDDDKVRYNIRVSRSEKRQMNPYVDAEFDDDEHEDDFDEDDGDDHEDAGNNAEHSDDREGSPGKVRASSAHNDSNTVKKRRDIKNRSKLELEKKRAAQKKKTKD